MSWTNRANAGERVISPRYSASTAMLYLLPAGLFMVICLYVLIPSLPSAWSHPTSLLKNAIHVLSILSLTWSICHLALVISITLSENISYLLFSSEKPTLDKDELSNYCPISDLSFISKIIEPLLNLLSLSISHQTTSSILISLLTLNITPLKQLCRTFPSTLLIP